MTKKPFRETTAGKFEYSVLVNSSDLLNNFRYNLSVLIWFALMISIVFVIFYDSLIILCFFFSWKSGVIIIFLQTNVTIFVVITTEFWSLYFSGFINVTIVPRNIQSHRFKRWFVKWWLCNYEFKPPPW